MVVPGAAQMDFLTAAFEAGMFPYIEGTTEDYIAQRRRRQRELRRAVEIHFSSGVWVQVNERPTHDGGFAAVYIDITERKRAEAELAEKEAQLRVALDNMPGGMMFADRDLNYVFFNAQYSELYEFPDGLVKVGGSAYDELRYQAERGDFGPGSKDELWSRWSPSTREAKP